MITHVSNEFNGWVISQSLSPSQESKLSSSLSPSQESKYKSKLRVQV